MKVSVIMACYNSGATVGAAIDSFLRQTHRDKELIVVDGASTDETLREVDRRRGDRVRVLSERDRGIYDAMNKGLSLSTGDAIGFLNSDDQFSDPDAMAAIAAGLADADVVFGDLDVVRSHQTAEIVRRWRSTPFRKGAFRRGWMPAHPTFYCRRTVLDQVGQFDVGFRLAADYDFMLRALELGDFKAARIQRVLVHMLHGGRTSSGFASYLSHNIESLAARRKHLGTGMIDYAFFAKPLRKIFQLTQRGG